LRLVEAGRPIAVPAHLQGAVQTMVDTASRQNPHETIKIDGKDYQYAMLYLLKPTNLANDALILTFCGLCAGKSAVRVVGVATASSASVRRPRQSLPDSLRERALALVIDGEALLMPVNFGNSYWCGIIVDVKLKRVLYFDPMNAKNYQRSLDNLSWALARGLCEDGVSGDFEVVSVNAPIQQDGYICEFYVCLKFWQFADPTVSHDISANGLLLFRFRMMHFILTGNTV
jgi:hypothetical protein